MFNAENSNQNQIILSVQQALSQIRAGQVAAGYLHDWSAGISLGDLTALPPDGPGMSTATAQAILSACADAYGLSLLYETGTDPRNPGAGYVYGASQKIVLGPTFK